MSESDTFYSRKNAYILYLILFSDKKIIFVGSLEGQHYKISSFSWVVNSETKKSKKYKVQFIDIEVKIWMELEI